MVANSLAKVHKSLRVGAAKAAHRFTSHFSIQDAKRLQAVVLESASCNRDGGLGLHIDMQAVHVCSNVFDVYEEHSNTLRELDFCAQHNDAILGSTARPSASHSRLTRAVAGIALRVAPKAAVAASTRTRLSRASRHCGSLFPSRRFPPGSGVCCV